MDFQKAINVIADHRAGMNLTDAIVLAAAFASVPDPVPALPLANLEAIALDSVAVNEARGKIGAIKELRKLTGCGLKDAKVAVEAALEWNAQSQRVQPLADWERDLLHSNPWDQYDHDEPPF